MNIKFDTNELERILGISFYNHNYYKLPYSIEGNNVVYQECDEGSNSFEYHLGQLIGGKFVGIISFWGDDEGNVDLINNRL